MAATSSSPITQVTNQDNDQLLARQASGGSVRPFLSRLLCCCTDDGKPARKPRPPPGDGTFLLNAPLPQDAQRKCLVLDLDETLVHSSFKPVDNADFVIPVEIDSQVHNVYVLKRPHVDDFMKTMGEYYEIVIFTASLAKYADPVLDKLDIHGVIRHRLFRESCNYHKGNYVKDLSRLGRELRNILIIDNSPASYLFHPENAIACSSWLEDPEDTELSELTPFLIGLCNAYDVADALASYQPIVAQ